MMLSDVDNGLHHLEACLEACPATAIQDPPTLSILMCSPTPMSIFLYSLSE